MVRGDLWPAAVGLLIVTAAIVGTLAFQSASSSKLSFGEARSPGAHRALRQSATASTPPLSVAIRDDHPGAIPEADSAVTEVDRAITEDDGALPDGVTAFDDEHPGVAKLDPDLLEALRKAATDAAAEGVELSVNSGWRSREYQDQLLREAISEYGSEKEAARWVATADTSAHVSGDAVDIGPVGATTWLSEHGARYGLCQIYRNESWHFELRPEAIDGRCPRMYADSAHDPRIQQ